MYYANNEIDTEYMIAVIEMLLAGENVGIKPRESIITPEIQLVKAYPNPFNRSLNIIYTLSNPGNVNIKIFDLTGRLISGFELGLQPAGHQNLYWSPGKNQRTAGLSSGMYIYQIETGKTITDGKMMYLK